MASHTGDLIDFEDLDYSDDELRGVNKFDDPTQPFVLNDDARLEQQKVFAGSAVGTLSSNIFADIDEYLAVKPDLESKCWRARPEVPTRNELMDLPEPWQKETAVVSLHPNITRGAFPSRERYLETHYELLREEAVSPLRNAIPYVKRLIREFDLAETTKRHTIGIYTSVRMRGFTFSNRGIGIEVSFSTKPSGKKIDWQMTSRLMTGTLVVLSSDNFQEHCIVATIAARDIEKLACNPPRIDLFFDQPSDIHVDPLTEYVMIEQRQGFFPAQRQALTAYQRLYTESFPLSDVIANLDNVSMTTPPNHIVRHPDVDISDIFPGHTSHDITRPFPVDSGASLDESQLEALHHIINKRLAIVQGPPGTGKTYVSVQALRILLSRLQPDDNPIMVACQTNHALDQLLGHVAAFELDFARLGGRSKDEGLIKERSMFNLRRVCPRNKRDPCGAGRRANFTKKVMIQQFSKLLTPLSCGEIKLQHLQVTGLLSETQCEHIRNGDQNWISTASFNPENLDPLYIWLGKSAIPTGSPDDVDDESLPVEDEEDPFRMELIHDQQAEVVNTKDDGDRDQLHGDIIQIEQTWTGRIKVNLSDQQAAAELKKNSNMWEISAAKRGALFNYLTKELKAFLTRAVVQLVTKYNQVVVAEIQKANCKRDVSLLRSKKLIAMTTTGLNINRALIYALQPKVLMIEEAAETLEALVVGGCVPSLEQLILVGDHQQLRPSTVVNDESYNFDISLFERLVMNNMSYSMLRTQRRMIPEIRQNLKYFYGDELQDHKSVYKRPRVTGMKHKFWLWSHPHPHQKDPTMSSFNPYEADMISGFYVYLLQNGYKPQQITILTFYRAQVRCIVTKLRQALTKKSYAIDDVESLDQRTVKIVTVDSYQGEENDIVILSLVRSTGTTGFTSSENRTCVALSRARNGLYIFGNMRLFKAESAVWQDVYDKMAAYGRCEDEDLEGHFPIYCEKHRVETIITDPMEWESIYGGCNRPCPTKLECDHTCPLLCHSFSHDSVVCEKPCEERLGCGHPCPHKCHSYSHKAMKCLEQCNTSLLCGHRCDKKCGEKCVCTMCSPDENRAENQVSNRAENRLCTRNSGKSGIVAVERTRGHELHISQGRPPSSDRVLPSRTRESTSVASWENLNRTGERPGARSIDSGFKRQDLTRNVGRKQEDDTEDLLKF